MFTTSFKLFLYKVFPEETISQIASERPILGAISTDPFILCISHLSLLIDKNFFNVLGYEENKFSNSEIRKT